MISVSTSRCTECGEGFEGETEIAYVTRFHPESDPTDWVPDWIDLYHLECDPQAA